MKATAPSGAASPKFLDISNITLVIPAQAGTQRIFAGLEQECPGFRLTPE
jgi:hypothetical protein